MKNLKEIIILTSFQSDHDLIVLKGFIPSKRINVLYVAFDSSLKLGLVNYSEAFLLYLQKIF